MAATSRPVTCVSGEVMTGEATKTLPLERSAYGRRCAFWRVRRLVDAAHLSAGRDEGTSPYPRACRPFRHLAHAPVRGVRAGWCGAPVQGLPDRRRRAGTQAIEILVLPERGGRHHRRSDRDAPRAGSVHGGCERRQCGGRRGASACPGEGLRLQDRSARSRVSRDSGAGSMGRDVARRDRDRVAHLHAGVRAAGPDGS